MIKTLSGKISDWSNRIRVFLFIFREEKVHRYFLILILLMVLSAVIFMTAEAENITKYIESTNNEVNLISKAVAVFYWSVITVSTTGYGDILPETNTGRVLVILMLFLSIVTVSLFTANLASALTSKKLLEGRGIMSITQLRDHFVICGWKERMGKFIEEIVNNNPGINIKKLTVIANIEPNKIELFRQNYSQFQDITIIRGDQYNENLLRKARIDTAAKVLILSDESNTDSVVGVDSLAVLTAMTVRAISVNVAISAELTDIKFEKYLHAAYVDEIIYTNEYSSALLSYSLQQVGLTKVVNDMLIQHHSAYLRTEKIPQEYYNKEYKALKNYFAEENILVIGLLENIGNLVERKKEAIRTAQKTADVNVLVSNLKAAKKIENNQSHLIPQDDYIVPTNSLAIVISKKRV